MMQHLAGKVKIIGFNGFSIVYSQRGAKSVADECGVKLDGYSATVIPFGDIFDPIVYADVYKKTDDYSNTTTAAKSIIQFDGPIFAEVTNRLKILTSISDAIAKAAETHDSKTVDSDGNALVLTGNGLSTISSNIMDAVKFIGSISADFTRTSTILNTLGRIITKCSEEVFKEVTKK